MTIDLNDKVSVITAAGNGIGRASALEFARLGAKVVASDIDLAAVEATVRAIHAAGGKAIALRTDVTDEKQVDALIEAAIATYGRLDILFNNAGGAQPKPTLDVSGADFRNTVALNLFSMYYGIHAALPVMVKQRSGVILSTTSGAGLGAVPGLAAYGAAKAGMISMTRSIAVEFGQYGIRANVISPGSMDTIGLRQWLDTLPGGDADYFAQIPSGRLGRAEDIARAAAFLVSDYSDYINGVTVPVDGGTAALLASPRV